MNLQRDHFKLELDSIAEKFRESLPEKLAYIEKLVTLAAQNGDNQFFIEEMYRLVHSLVGSAGTFGYTDISKKARDMLESINGTNVGKKISGPILNKLTSHLIPLRNAARLCINSDNLTKARESYLDIKTDCELALNPLKILLASDDELLSAWISTALSLQNHNVTVFDNGLDCINSTENYEYDAILLEVMIPGLNGYEIAKKIRGHNQTSFMPIIFITTLKDCDSINKCILSGGDDVISKPFTLDVLKSRLFAYERIKHQYLSAHA